MDLKTIGLNILKEFMLDPDNFYVVVSEIINYYLEQLDLPTLLLVLDKDMSANEVFQKIPKEVIAQFRQVFSALSPEDKMRVRALAYKLINTQNVMSWLMEQNPDIYGIFINHPNGMKFMENFISYILKNLDTWLM
ncbi:MAG: hypothetical protein QXV17_04690 [Candidatus Micrarchaeaceae archaeon]